VYHRTVTNTAGKGSGMVVFREGSACKYSHLVKGGGIGAAGAAILFSSNMGHP